MYRYEVLSDLPSLYYLMNEAGTTITDYSGRNRPMTLNGTCLRQSIGVTESLYTIGFPYGAQGTFTVADLFSQDSAQKSFTVEFIYRSSTPPDTRRQIAGKGNDGIYVSTAGFELIVGTTRVVNYVTDWSIYQHVVMVYSPRSLSLIVNGFDTNAQVRPQFSSNMPVFTISNTVNDSFVFYISNFAIYDRILSDNQIQLHISFINAGDYRIRAAGNGDYVVASDSAARAVINKYETGQSFLTGTRENVDLKSGVLYLEQFTKTLYSRPGLANGTNAASVAANIPIYVPSKNILTVNQSAGIWDEQYNSTQVFGIIGPTGRPDAVAVEMPNGVQSYYGAAVDITKLLPNTLYTFSVWVRADGGREVALYASGDVNIVGNWIQTPVDQDWIRLSRSFTTNANNLASVRVGIVTDSPYVFAAENNYIYTWHPQLEAGTNATEWTQGGLSALLVENSSINLFDYENTTPSANNGGTVAKDTSKYWSAPDSWKFTTTDNTQNPAFDLFGFQYQFSSNNFNTSGDIVASAMVNVPYGRQFFIRFFSFNADGNYDNYNGGNYAYFTGTGTWQHVAVSRPARPTLQNQMQLRFGFSTAGSNGDTFNVDNVKIEYGLTPTVYTVYNVPKSADSVIIDL